MSATRNPRTLSLPVLSSDASKADEIAFLQAVADACAPGTYLSSLFSPALLGWAEDKIRSDFSCDLMEHFDGAIRDADRNAIDLRNAKADHLKDTASLNETIATLQAQIEERDEQHKELAFRYNRETQEWSELYQAESARRHDAEQRRSELVQQVIELKARLFDMIEREQARSERDAA